MHKLERSNPLPACFIIATAGTKLAPLTRVVQDAGWRVLNLESVIPGEEVFLETSRQLIQAASAVIVVLNEPHSPDTLFQAGLALGMGKLLLLIAEDEAIIEDGLPDRILAALPRVRAKIEDTDAVRFHVTAFLDGVTQTPTHVISDAPSKKPFSKVTSGRSRRSSQPASQLEAQLLDVFEKAAEVEAAQLEPQMAGNQHFRPDFALWLSDTRQILPNPLIVELANARSPHGLNRQRRLDQLQKYALDTGVGAAMLIEAGSPQSLHLLQIRPMLFHVGLDEVQMLLSEGRLVPEMIRVRNLLAHSAS